MRTKAKVEFANKITNDILQAIDGTKSNVSSDLKRAFYFKGRKSEEIGTRVIEAISNPNDIVLDPFFGGGSFIISAIMASRFIYGIELDNYTYDVFKHLFIKSNNKKLTDYFEKIQEMVKDDVMYLYRTKCCNQENYIKKLLFDPEDEEYYNPQENREIVDGKNIVLMERCSICGEKRKKFDDFDYSIIEETNTLNVEEFPKENYIENSRINITASTGADRYDRVFSIRNQYALLLIQEAITSLPDCVEKNIIQHALVSSLALSKISMYGSSTDILYHVINNKGQDMNVWHLFESNFKSMLKFKNKFGKYQVEDIENNDYFCLMNGSYNKILDENPEMIADLIYTDFPYTDQVPYLERNQLFRLWLRKFVDSEKFDLTEDMLKEEIVLTNAPSRKDKNNIQSYYKDIDRMFAVLRNHIKTDKLLVFTMKLGEAKYIRTYSEIINLARKNGFEYITRIGIDKTDPTLRKQSAYANTFMNEMIVVFQKLDKHNEYWYLGDINYEFVATKLIYKHLIKVKNIETTTLTSAVEIVKNDLLSKGHLSNKEDISKIVKTIKDNFFVSDGFVEIDNNRLYMDIEDETTLFVKLYDLIPLYIKKLLDKDGSFVLEDLYLELTNSLCDGTSSTLMQILEDRGHQNSIQMLLNNYCSISNGHYVEKRIMNLESLDSDDISQYTGTDFEVLMKSLLEKEGYFNIVIVGGAGDRGVDLIASKLVNKDVEKTIFQCKRWIGNVGSEPIQRLFAEREHHKYKKAICVTTSNYTSEGKKAAKDFDVETWDGFDVMMLLEKHFPGKYYNRALDIEKE
ncbi:MAG TPA: restriction endonuclease [Bacteroidales bacterium]|nr:restriction endonuclease [Bacteroidales bacterium]